MKKSLFYILVLVLAACSSFTSKPVENKVRPWAKVDQSKTGLTSSQMPNFFLGKFNKAQVKKTRAPASNPASLQEELSSRRSYFLSLYSQYLRLLSIVGDSRQEVKFCPSYHNDILSRKDGLGGEEKIDIESVKYQALRLNQKNIGAFPEMSLIAEVQDGPVINSIEKSPEKAHELIRKGLSNHLKIVRSEIESLCNTGVSDNYYLYENFIRHLEKNPDFWKSTDKVVHALKIPIVANFYLLNIIGKSEGTEIERMSLRKIGMDWMAHSIREIKQVRAQHHHGQAQ